MHGTQRRTVALSPSKPRGSTSAQISLGGRLTNQRISNRYQACRRKGIMCGYWCATRESAWTQPPSDTFLRHFGPPRPWGRALVLVFPLWTESSRRAPDGFRSHRNLAGAHALKSIYQRLATAGGRREDLNRTNCRKIPILLIAWRFELRRHRMPLPYFPASASLL